MVRMVSDVLVNSHELGELITDVGCVKDEISFFSPHLATYEKIYFFVKRCDYGWARVQIEAWENVLIVD